MSDTERVSAELMQWQLNTLVEGRNIGTTSFRSSSFGGVNVNLPDLLTVNHPLVTEKDAVHYVAAPGTGERCAWTMRSPKRAGSIAKNLFPPALHPARDDRADAPVHRDAAGEEPVRDGVCRSDGGGETAPDARREELRAQAEKIVAAQVYPGVEASASRCSNRWSAARRTMRGCGGSRAVTRPTRFALRRFTTTRISPPTRSTRSGSSGSPRSSRKWTASCGGSGRTEGTLADRVKAIEKSQSYPLTDDGRKQIMADTEQILRDAEQRAALQFDVRPKAHRCRAAVSALPRGERRRQLQRARARRIAARHVSDSAAARTDDEVHAAHARVSRDGAGPSLSDRARDGERGAAAVPAHPRIRRHLRAERGMGPVRRASGGGVGLA